MNRRRDSGSWVHIFSEDAFGGRLRQLGPGEREPIGKIRSIIVGPRAQAGVVDRDGREIKYLAPRKVVGAFSQLAVKRALYIRVEKA